MMKKFSLCLALVVIITFYNSALSQTISKEELIFLTSEWKGERFPDGRPKISDDLLKRAKNLVIEDAWQILNNEG